MLSSGERYELEATTILQTEGHNDAFLTALADFASPASGTSAPTEDTGSEDTGDDDAT